MMEVLRRKLIKHISLLFPGRRYMIYYSHKGKIMWYMIPKNASRTIRYHLEIAYPDFVFVGNIPIVRWLWQGYFKFAVRRDDQERYKSAYRDKVLIRKLWTFKEYAEHLKSHDDHHVSPQYLLYDPTFVDMVIDIDNLDELFRRLNIKGKIECINSTGDITGPVDFIQDGEISITYPEDGDWGIVVDCKNHITQSVLNYLQEIYWGRSL